MAQRLFDNLTSDYLAAAARLAPHGSRRKGVVYVESYDDIFFWRSLLDEVEALGLRFEVMLPSQSTLGKGKKVALMNALSHGLGKNLIACVDADYDYLLQGTTEISRLLCNHPWVFHTYVYAIENYQCYAPSLHTVCVMATLNDRDIFDFEDFFSRYSRIIFPLFAWSVWCYRNGRSSRFSMQDFVKVVQWDSISLNHPERMLESVKKKVNAKIAWLQRSFPEARGKYQQVVEDIRKLGVNDSDTYLFMRGHDLFENLVVPLLTAVCRTLTHERENEIRRLAVHDIQKQSELAHYTHSSASVEDMLRKQTEYKRAPLYRMIVSQIKKSQQEDIAPKT